MQKLEEEKYKLSLSLCSSLCLKTFETEVGQLRTKNQFKISFFRETETEPKK